MRTALIVLVAIVVATATLAADRSLPPEVQTFIHDRDLCDHFRGEPFEGNSPEQIKRREFIVESLEIYCPGTDRRLAALKRRYKEDVDVLERLKKYEEQIEGRNP
jgi:hypothetical protein